MATADAATARAAKAKAARRELRRSNQLSRFYAADTPRARFYAALDVWRAFAKRLPPQERDAQYERLADLLVNDALQIDTNTTRMEAA